MEQTLKAPVGHRLSRMGMWLYTRLVAPKPSKSSLLLMRITDHTSRGLHFYELNDRNIPGKSPWRVPHCEEPTHAGMRSRVALYFRQWGAWLLVTITGLQFHFYFVCFWLERKEKTSQTLEHAGLFCSFFLVVLVTSSFS